MQGFGGLALLWAAGLVGCTGEVDVYLTDRSGVAPGGELEIAELLLPLDRVDAQRDGEWVALARGPDPYNLLDFSSESTVVDLVTLREQPARIAHDEVPVGPISALRLVLTPGELVALTMEDGVIHTLDVPADADWQVELPMEVVVDAPASCTFDLRVRDATVRGEDGTWSFVPALELVEE
ncbi:MAG: DUF4382 domain-containing protein [Pseudomonadota bacterium]|nr:DUF4382 domain-containing protein [Pseudomonadota bacterium]